MTVRSRMKASRGAHRRSVAEIRAYFESRLERHGDSPKSLDWSAQGQQTRFEILARVGNLRGQEVLDVGCGLGHFHDFLRTRFPDARYTGVDLSPRMVEAARKRLPEATLEVWDASSGKLPWEADYVIASGVMNLEIGNNEAAMRGLLRVCFRACRVAVAVNMLSRWADWFDEGRHYYDPIRTLRDARRLTSRVVLRHDYMPHDFTLYLYRGP